MSLYSDRVLTESFRDKRYEEDLTKLYFTAMRILNNAHMAPTLEYIKTAYSASREFCEALVYSKDHLVKYRDLIKPTLQDAQTILYGDPRSPFSVRAATKYNCRIIKKRGKYEILNGVRILNQLSEVVFLAKQYAYQQGLLLPKPMDKKFGIEAIEDNLKM